MIKHDLEFLLKEKYGYSDVEIFEIYRNNKNPEKEFSSDIRKEIALLKKGYPVDYLIGYKFFLGSKINLDKKPLIPRPETEYWVNQALQDIALRGKSAFLDIFTGSGCIGISIMRHIKNAFVVFADIDKKCLEQAQLNLNINKVDPKNVEIIRSDIYSKLAGSKFDAIFANPPYVGINETNLPKELQYEPSNALYANSNGLEIIIRFLDESYKFLNDDGVLYMEFGETQKDEIERFLKSHGKYKNWKFYKDQYKKWRWLKTERADL